MQPAELLKILSVAEKRKCNTRHSYASSGRHESVAEHSWRIALMEWVRTFPEPERSEWEELYAEMNALDTVEAKRYKALDKIEAVSQHDAGKDTCRKRRKIVLW